MQLFDAHCHVALLGSEGDGDGEALSALERAAQAGIRAVVTADELDSPAFAPRPPLEIYRAVGRHPWRADEPLDLERLRAALGADDVVALGEVGLDGDSRRPPLDRQTEVLRQQLALAAELDLPLVLHAHKHHEPLLALLGEQAAASGGALRGLVHGFTKGPELATRYTELGLCVGLGALLRDARAWRLRETATELPLERLVLESDAPSAAIAELPATARTLAELRGLTAERVAEETTRNARRLYGLD